VAGQAARRGSTFVGRGGEHPASASSVLWNTNEKEKKLRKLMLLAAMFAVTMLTVAPALAQDDPQVVADAKAKTATAGGPSGANADANCDDGIIESKAGGVVAKAPCEKPPPPPPKAAPAPPPKAAPAPPPKAAPAPPPPPAPAPPPPPAPKAAPAPPPPPAPAPPPPPKAEEKKELPKSGGSGVASLFALGGGALLVAGGLLVRRIVR
jgi:LPXTG-motif cell wall-anchored protein